MTLRPGCIALAVLLSGALAAAAQPPAPPRPRVALALGGGSARGLAHVGVLKWLEEHRVPVDAIAGTSMGGLIGGAYAAGMSPAEIETLVSGIDWDAMFGASSFRFDHVRRKRDLRDYTSRLEFGLKHGIAGPPALNPGQQVGLLLSRIAAAYSDLQSFDDLPTPFRCVAVDIRTARPVVLRDGPLARGLRATIAMPLTFPPVVVDDQILVDGGVLNNLPADVARAMGAGVVIAVNVADLGRKSAIDYTLLGLVAESMDAMIRAASAANLASADVGITVPLDGFLATDFHRTPELIAAGYHAAEASRDKLLPLALDDARWTRWKNARRDRTRTRLPAAAFVRVEGAGPVDAARIERRLSALRGKHVDIDAIERSVNELGGLDRFETVTWSVASEGAQQGVVFKALEKSNGPPFLFLGVTLENTTSNEFRFGVGARFLAFDVLGSGTEFRVNGALGSEPGVGASWHRPLGSSPLFIEPVADARTRRVSIIEDGRIAAEYGRRRIGTGVDVGLNPGRLSEVRFGARAGRTDANVRLGDARLPDISGADASLGASWTYDGQDDPLLPSRGAHVLASATHILRAPDIEGGADDRAGENVTMAEVTATWFRSLTRDRTRRLFAFGGAGRTFDGRPLVIDQFELGGPARMTAFGIGAARGDHYTYAGAGYLHRLFRLPDFLGRSVFAGGWAESGSAFTRGRDADLTVHASAAVIADTLVGPIFAGASAGIRGESRFFIGIGRIFGPSTNSGLPRGDSGGR
ncbi:MAG TPA: patatin-like phospholipase family protein [Vicinamibacterales bacterium]|nr:patatin-like phospholipase family protein [Vicinamibacterales bacterium]